METAPIGIMDSGLGGLTIWRAISRLLPSESTIYVGDHQFLPYSRKSTPVIRGRVKLVLDYFRKRKVKLAVIACNTATVVGIDYYRRLFPGLPIVGVVPVVKTAASVTQKKRFAVLSTALTARSSYQKKLIGSFARDCTVYNVGCTNLVSLIEEGRISGKQIQRELTKILTPLLADGVDVVALGCTHYPFLQNEIRAIVGDKVKILDSGGAVARHVYRILDKNKALALAGRGRHEFYTTGEAAAKTDVASRLLGRKIILRSIDL